MIDALLAKKLIERLSECTDYNINIMDENGIIIASKNPSRVGTFHEVALQIIRGDAETIIVENESTQFGVKKGVNMAIYYKKRKEGVVGITGEPGEVKSIALTVRMAVEVMLEYELFKYEKMKRHNLKDQMLNLILYGDDLRIEDLDRYITQLQLRDDVNRIPILFHIGNALGSNENLIDAFRGGRGYSSQDLIGITREGDILLYKALDYPLQELMKNQKYLIGEAISEILRYLRSAGFQYTVYIGTIQNNFLYYRMGFGHCMWLKKNISTDGSVYFNDYVNQYFLSVLPLTELEVVYSVIEKGFGTKLSENFKEIIGALINSNYNLNVASKQLHLHKNTLVYRLDKIRDLLSVDPLGNNNDREFVNNLYYYLLRKEHIYQVH